MCYSMQVFLPSYVRVTLQKMVLQVSTFKDLEASIGNVNHLSESANSPSSCEGHGEVVSTT